MRTLLLLLLLAMGPLQAQIVFACTVMEMPAHDVCCCDDSKTDDSCGKADCHSAHGSVENPCCEASLKVSVNEDVRERTPVVKPPEVRSDVDPPPAITAPVETVPTSRPLATQSYPALSPAAQPGSRTYLITQRLRI